jgi:hypothetical protein
MSSAPIPPVTSVEGDTPMSTRKQKLRAAATETPPGQSAKAAKKDAKVKKTSRGK